MNKALFLDRDGVINVEKNYVHKIEDFEFVDGIFELCTAAQDLGYLLIVVTNQAGIARGYYSLEQFKILTQWMKLEFKRRGIEITKVYHCPFHPSAGIGEYKKDSFDRKPNPGMLLRASEEFQLDLANSILIGDNISDIQAAFAAKVSQMVLFSDSADEYSEYSNCFTARTLSEIKKRLFVV